MSTRTAVAAPWSLTVTIKQDGFKYRHRPAHRTKRPCVSKTTCLADSITNRGNPRMLRCIGSGIPALLEVAPVEMTTTTRIPLPQPPPAALAAVDPPPSLPKPRPHASLKSDSPPPLSKRRPHAPPHAVPPLSLARHPHAHWPDSLWSPPWQPHKRPPHAVSSTAPAFPPRPPLMRRPHAVLQM